MRLKTICVRGAVFVLTLLPVLQTFPAGAVAVSEKPSLESLEYSLDKTTKKATFISAGRDKILPLNSQALTKAEPTAVARQVIKEYGTFFGLRDPLSELSLFKEQIDRVGMTHVRYTQQYQGVPVFGGQIIVHLGKDGLAKSLNGKVVPNVELNTKPKVSAEAAIAKAREIWKKQFGLDEAEVIKAELYILNQSLIDKRFEDKNYLVWRIELRQEKPLKDEFYFIDAHTERLVYQLTGVKNAIDREIWDGSYGPWTGYWGLDDYLCVLGICYTYGRSEGQPARGTNPWWLNTDVDDLYAMVNYCHNYVSATFGIDGANNAGGLGDGITEEVGTSRVKAYLDDSGYPCPNAYSNDYEIAFCYGMVVTDVVAHEYGHSVLTFAVPDIPYTSESGAVHEAYADITGEAVEYYSTASNDWLNGGGITLVPSTPRSLISPGDYDDGLGNNPATYYSDDFYCGSGDNYGVHHNSTVISHAAYLMAMGGTQTGCTVTAIGRAKQEQIFYQAITNYITTAVDFNQVYDALNLACDDLYSEADCDEVKQALMAVEINQSLGPCNGGTEATPGCVPPSTPVASPGGGTYGSSQSVTLTSTNSTSIRYTTDGTDPTASSNLYSGAITISSTTTLKARGYGEFDGSSVMTETYTISPTVSTWYLAEGFTNATTATYILIQNPSDTTANLTLTYMIEGADNVTKQYSVAANKRYTIYAANDVGLGRGFSTKITSDQSVIVERAMYFTEGGHDSIGVSD